MAGFWKKDWEDAEFRCHLKADDSIIERFNNGKMRLIDRGAYIHIVDFIFFQYNKLKFESKPHQAVIDLLDKYINKGLITEQLANSYLSVKDKDKDKDKDKVKDKDKGIYGQFKNVYLKEEEVLKLKEQFGSEFEHKVENLSNYIAMKGDKYKSHYAVILNWATKDTKTIKKSTFGRLHDGTKVEWKFGRWVDAQNPNAHFDLNYYKELANDTVISEDDWQKGKRYNK